MVHGNNMRSIFEECLDSKMIKELIAGLNISALI